MSSPDPLNESDGSQHPLSSRRVTRSHATVRHYSLGSSPKKQTFELDVGNEISPQKILVTVEAEDAAESSGRSVNRRLFQSPSVKRSARRNMAGTSATTTTVPLRGLTDDESNAATDVTPRRRGRPPRSDTPAKTTMRKRQGTPSAKKASAQPRRAKASARSGVLASETSADDQATPRPASRAKTGTKRKASSPIKDSSVTGSLPRKRGRPRKQTILSPELATLSEQEHAMDAEIEDNASVGQTDDNVSVAGSRADEGLGDGIEDDIWLATLSDQPTPVARRSTRTNASIPGSVPKPAPEPAQADASDRAPSPEPQDWDALGSGAHSDVESLVSEERDGQERQDTLMASEEFTMISLGSLPSMRANSSMLASSMMATEPQDLGEETNLIIDRALESLRQSQMGAEKEVQEEQPDDAPDTSCNQSQVGPRSQPTSPHTSNRSPRRATKLQSLGRQLAIKSLQGGAADSPERPPALDAPESHDMSAYDDSFSEIPEEVLVAATPRRLRQPPAEVEEDTPKPDVQPSIERPSSVNHSNPQSESNRLLTPDETPSPIPSDGEETHEKPTVPPPDQDISSSPPIPSALTQRHRGNSVVRHSRTNSTETPAEQVSAFVSPTMAALNAHSINLAPPEPQPRPTLSPIVRAGRALQLVTSDPPSPPGRDSVLRSPFRGSVRSSQSPAPSAPRAPRAPQSPVVQAPPTVQQPERSWFDPLSQIKSFVVQGALALSPRQKAAVPMEDPFGPGPTTSPVPDSVRNFVSNLRGRQHTAQEPDVEAVNSTRATVSNDDDAMSWQGEESGAEERPQDRYPSHSSSINAACGSPANKEADVSIQEEADFGMQEDEAFDEQASPHEEAEDVGEDRGLVDQQGGEGQDLEEEEEEYDDIWAFEAQRPTPGKPKLAPPRVEEVDPPRRSKIPSPWRREGERVARETLPRNQPEVGASQDGLEDLSMLSQQSRKGRKSAPRNQLAPKNVNLSAFFSSPAALPDATGAAGFGLFKALDAPGPFMSAKNRNVGQQQAATTNPGDRMIQPFGDITNKQSLFQPPREQRATQKKNLEPVRPADKQPVPATRLAPQKAATSAPQTSSPATPERVRFDHVLQKQNFTPRSRQAANDLFQPRATSLFGSNPIPVFSMQAASREEIHDQDDSPETSSGRPRLKPLPSRAQSPSKSCMRSPLKPKTPGRVVEFTSSTLSPLAQAQVRAERRASASPEKQLSTGSNASSAGSSVTTEDKENEDQAFEAESYSEQEQEQQPHDYQMLASPSPVKSSFARPASPVRVQRLSQTQWSRDHWLRLDELLQARRQGILQFQLQLTRARGPAGKARSIESQMLLGKLMRARGREMPVEEWHLDVVNAFRDEVGWWDEVDLVKRVLGLLVGEDLRRRGLVPRHRSSSVSVAM